MSEAGNSLQPLAAPGPVATPGAGFALDSAMTARLEAVAREVAGEFLAIPVHDPAFDRKSDQLSAIGRRESEALGELARRSLARSSASQGATAALDSRLGALRQVIESLDPGAGSGLPKQRKLFGLFAVGEPVARYFDRYRSAQDAIAEALAALRQGRDRLLHDNVAIDADRKATRPLLGSLSEAVHLCAQMDARLDKLAGKLEASDPDRARRIRESALFRVRQRHTDLLTEMAIALQGYQVLEIVRANNRELAEGVDRASATTITALRTAMVAAQALSDQRLLLDRIAGVTAAATSAIEASSAPLADANVQDSAGANAQMAALRRAFAEVYATVDAATERQRAGLRALQETGNRLSLESR